MHPIEPLPTAPPLFIVGCPRSGTTLLRLMLASHSHLGIPPEGTFIRDLYPTFGNLTTFSNDTIRDFVHQFFAIRKCSEWLLHRERLIAYIIRRKPSCYADLIRAVYEYYLLQRQPGRKRWGDKNPIYVMNIPLLHTVFPDAKFIHLIRDGRDVAISHRHPAFHLHAVTEAAQLWKTRVLQGHLDGRRLGKRRYLELRYEDLCLYPKRTLAQVCHFCALPFEYDRMINFYNENRQQKLVPPHRYAWHMNTLHPLIADRIGVWKHEMRTDEVLSFQNIAGDILEKFGYEVFTPSTGASGPLPWRPAAVTWAPSEVSA